MVSGSTEFCIINSCPEAVVPCSGRISWNTSSEFINFFFDLLIGFFYSFLTWQALVKCINASLMW